VLSGNLLKIKNGLIYKVSFFIKVEENINVMKYMREYMKANIKKKKKKK